MNIHSKETYKDKRGNDMTKDEAIEILKYNSNVIHQTINGETDPKEVEALDMAIKALEQEKEKENGKVL